MNKTFKKILSVCCTVVTTLTATLFRSTEVRADNDYKIVFIGDEKVGKTQLAKRIAENGFSDDYKFTLGVCYSTRTTTAGDSLQLFDLAGEERFRSLGTMYCQRADVLLYCCSAQQLKSYTQNCNIAQYNIPSGSKVLICITQEDTMPDVTRETKTQLGQALKTFQTAAPECTILPEILVTSAMKNQYKFCTPENYDSTTYKNIYQNLAEDLVNLCKGQETAQHTVNSDSTATNTQKASDENTHSKKKSGVRCWLGIATTIFSLGAVFEFGCYENDRHKKTKAVNHQTGEYIQHENKKIKKLLNN